MNTASFDFKTIINYFQVDGDYEKACPYGGGHINDTFAVSLSGGGYDHALLQRINTYVFKDPVKLMSNIEKVTIYLNEAIVSNRSNYLRETLHIIPARDGASFAVVNGDYWRVYNFVENSISYESIESKEQMYTVGRAFGNLQCLLSGFPASSLYESIPDFHNTPKRFEAFVGALNKDVLNRASSCSEEIDFVLSRKENMSVIQGLIESGEIPVRVTHNDTKLNNILFDIETGKAVCVVDLDTTMPGTLLFDFGDSIRFGASTAAEDERDLNKVSVSLEYYNAYNDGFLEEAGGMMRDLEKELLPMGAKTMMLECGMRFLTDHLSGDHYFKIHRTGHNLDRARTQFKLARDMEKLFGI